MINENQETDMTEAGHSLRLIREMIQVSQARLRNDGILFIAWGWMMFYMYATGYIISRWITTVAVRNLIEKAGYVLGALVLAYTIYYIVRQHRKVQTYIGISLRYVWISLVVCLVLINLIQFNVLHSINFELQHPIFMVCIAFAVVVTGGILRHAMLIAGGIVFGVLAYFCSYLRLEEQMIVEAFAWLLAFIIPGHVMYARRKKV